MTPDSPPPHSSRHVSLSDALSLVGPPPPIPLRVLLVDAERRDRDALRRHLELAGFAIDEAADGRTALSRLRSLCYGLIVLDLALPDIDGLSLCRTAREGPSPDAAIIVVSARDGEADKVRALTSGADDYVTKPFGLRELLARVGAVVRRTRRSAPDAPAAGPAAISLDAARRQAIVDGRRVELTRQEFEVLHQLAARPGTVFSRTALLHSIWGEDTEASERTVDVAISRLRRKLERDRHEPQLIQTAWGVGYRFGG